jgi:hypothetical protein
VEVIESSACVFSFKVNILAENNLLPKAESTSELKK